MGTPERQHAWWRDGLCAQVGSDLFFMDRPNDAIRTCTMCSVRAECLADALVSDIEHGVFGGFARTERRRLRKRVEAGADPMAVAVEACYPDVAAAS